jgi:hypothetical protein
MEIFISPSLCHSSLLVKPYLVKPEPVTKIGCFCLIALPFQNRSRSLTCIGKNDSIINAIQVVQKVKASKETGGDIEYHFFRDANHGFGLGTGTNAEG